MAKALFESSMIHTMALKNRLIRSATYEGLATEEGMVTEKLVNLYQKLAQGGVGLIITGHAYIQENGHCGKGQTGIYHDDCIPGLKKLVDAAHKGGAKIAAQIVHAGRQTTASLINGSEPLAPCAMPPDPLFHSVPRAMTIEEIDDTIQAFGDAALRSRKAGFDAVQIHGAHGYLIAQFLSPYTNRRNDEWGGHFENRMRFVLKVIENVRKKVGPDYPVMIKLSAEEGVNGGMSIAEACVVAKELKKSGINAIEVSGGIVSDSPFTMCRGDVPIDLFTDGLNPKAKARMEASLYAIADMVTIKEAYWADNADKIKAAVKDLPIITVGGMRYPQTMAGLVSQGTDYIALSRPLIKEPSLPCEMAEGRKSPAACSFCNRCLAMVGKGKPLQCYNR